jgi:hypothetical protein
LKNSIKKGVKTVVSRLGRPRAPLGTLCTSQDMLCNFEDTDTSSNAMRAKAHSSGPRDSLASFVSSDSITLAAWLAERRATASCITPREMSVEEYELMGSWLDLRQCDQGWVCGVQDCDMHTAGGSPCVAGEYPNGLRMAMPFYSADLTDPPVKAPTLAFPAGPFSAPQRFHSLPRLPCQSFEIHSAQEAKPATLKDAERCLRELSMPGGWTFN